MITVTMTFDSPAAAAAFLAGNAGPSAAAPSTSSASSQRTASAEPADAQPAKATTYEPAASKTLNYKDDVLPALQAYSKRVTREVFAKLMGDLGVKKVPEIEGKADLWPRIMKEVAA